MEIEGFRFGAKPMLIKEMAWWNLGTRSGDNVIFRFTNDQTTDLELTDWKQMRFYEKSVHGIPFFFGDTPFESLALIIRVIRTHCRCLITKGQEKAVILRQLFGLPVYDLGETLGTPSYRKLAAKYPIPVGYMCKFHKSAGVKGQMPHCSKIKINLLLAYCLQRNISKSCSDSTGVDTVR